ncbi:metalloprotease [Mycoemilia scoparia]|uniref:Metalloprotease n=1 Tax=Mycoemilia scoparia TaxID=417184 RepID=A0A9W8DT96_9FUNG|nr:metalloprotease [Mycoemilia scoparia]
MLSQTYSSTSIASDKSSIDTSYCPLTLKEALVSDPSLNPDSEHTANGSAGANDNRFYVRKTLDPINDSDEPITYYQYEGGKLATMGQDTREHRLLKLSNNMEVLITHDDKCITASGTLRVEVGSISVKSDFEGLAHLLEHMLFLGTEKHPDPNHFNHFLSINGGYTNAYTDLTHTAYQFMVTKTELEEALDRFSQFFISPLINPECTDREAKIVDSEFKGGFQDDTEKFQALIGLMSKLNHPLRTFSCGNYETLVTKAKDLGVNLRDAVADFFEKYYSSDIMKLAVCGGESLDELTRMVVTKFTPVKSKGITVENDFEAPFGPEELGRIAQFETTENGSLLCIEFPFPNIDEKFMEQPALYLERLCNSSDKGSLYKHLQDKGLIIDLGITVSSRYFTDSSSLSVNIVLTEEGYKSYKYVLKAVFAYFAMLRKNPPGEEFFHEQKELWAQGFKFATISRHLSFVENVVSNLANPYCPKYLAVVGDSMVKKYSFEAISNLINILTIKNCFMLLGSKNKDGKVKFTDHYELYDFKYRIDPFDEEFVQMLDDPKISFKLTLPKPNKYICRGLKNKEEIERGACHSNHEYTLLLKNDQGEVWYSKDSRFPAPKGKISTSFVIPKPKSLRELSYTTAFGMMTTLRFNSLMSGASDAGLFYGTNGLRSSVGLEASGYTPKLLKFFEKVVAHYKLPLLWPVYFKTLKDILKLVLREKEIELEEVVSAHEEFLDFDIIENPNESFELISKVEYLEFKKHVSKMFKEVYFITIAAGEFDEQVPLEIHSRICEKYKPKKLAPDQLVQEHGLYQHPGKHLTQLKTSDPKSLQCIFRLKLTSNKPYNHLDAVHNSIIANLLEQEIHKKLRTEEGLGYVVSCSTNGMAYERTSIIINISSNCDPSYIHLRVNKFLREFRDNYLESLTEDEYKSVAKFIKELINTPDYDLDDEFERIEGYIENGTYDFSCPQALAKCTEQITKDSVLKFWDREIDILNIHGTNSPIVIYEGYRLNDRMPTMAERQMYPESILGLYGCLHNADILKDNGGEERNKNLKENSGSIAGSIFKKKAKEAIPVSAPKYDIEYSDVSTIISDLHKEYLPTNTSKSGNVMDSIVKDFKYALLKQIRSATIDKAKLDKAFESEKSFCYIALQMAIDQYVEPLPESHKLPKGGVNGKDFIYATPEGIPVFEDFVKFREGMKKVEPLKCVRELKPKYTEYHSSKQPNVFQRSLEGTKGIFKNIK